MNLKKSPNLEKVIVKAEELARKLNHTHISPLHLLAAILETPGCRAYRFLEERLAVSLQKLANATSTRFCFEASGKPTGEYTGDAKLCWDIASDLAAKQGEVIRTEHLLLMLLQHTKLCKGIFEPLRIAPQALQEALLSQFGLQAEAAGPEPDGNLKSFEEFCVNLNDQALKGKIDPVVGRDEEIRRISFILGRKKKNNPLLIGDAGVGKTAIVEGLTRSIVQKTCPDFLRNRVIYALSLQNLVANSVWRGQFEGRLKLVLDYVKAHPEVLLFVDEVHQLVGAGQGMGSMDASNIMKPALSRGEVQAIGATTLDEYRRYIEKDAALERRFQPVRVHEPSDADTLKILMNLAPTYEAHHRVRYTDDAIAACLTLSKRYITTRFLPDKAIDILDEAGSVAKQEPNAGVQQLNRLIEQIKEEKLQALHEERLEVIPFKVSTINQLVAKRDALMAEQHQPKTVDMDVILRVVSRISGLPVENLTAEDRRSLMQLEQRLNRHVIGQSAAVKAVCRYLRRAKNKLNDPQRPIGSFMLLGPTGVGKTLLAKRLAVELSGSMDNLIALDMSEYMEKHTASRLIGSPPGYVGYEDGNTLVERIRRQPYAVVLFDEIEKAHTDVHNLLLQILEEGKLTDGQGREANFCNTLILLSSNIGAQFYRPKEIGFGARTQCDYAAIQVELKRVLRPELINRLDETLIFRALEEEDIGQIIDLELAKIQQRLPSPIHMHPSVRAYLRKEGFSEEYGGRFLKKAMEKAVSDPISDALLEERIQENYPIEIIMEGDWPIARNLTTPSLPELAETCSSFATA